jgi:hypothetical protein
MSGMGIWARVMYEFVHRQTFVFEDVVGKARVIAFLGQ